MSKPRITAGMWRNRPLQVPAGATTRPTSSRTRETLFSMLTSRLGGFTGLRVADLFAGSGALGLEALSRGASFALFVERDACALAALRSNIAALDAGIRAQILAGNVASQPAPATPFDLIFADPPYGEVDLADLVDRLVSSLWLTDAGMICVEGAARAVPRPIHADLVAERIIGKAMIHLYRPA